MENETTKTSTSGCGSLILEMGALSRLTGDSRYEPAALRALRKLRSMRSSLNLVVSTIDVSSGKRIEYCQALVLVLLLMLGHVIYRPCNCVMSMFEHVLF